MLPSWETLSKILDAKSEIPSETLSRAKVRLFGEDKESKLIFYRDDSAWCPYCEYIWLALEEKKISYEVKKIQLRGYGQKPKWYYDKVPSGLVPAIEIDGKILGGDESSSLLLQIEELFPEHKSLLPAEGTEERGATEDLLNLWRELVSLWRKTMFSSWEHLEEFEDILTRIDEALRKFGGPYFLGKEFSIVDAVFVSFLERVVSILPYFHGLEIRSSGRWPAIDTWFEALLSRPVYNAIKSDDFTNVHATKRSFPLPELPGGATFRAKIDGTDGSWHLPLKPIELPLGKDDGTGSNGAKEEAAKTLVKNHEAVVGFALRSLEREADEHREAVDLALRCVAHALLVGVENVCTLPPINSTKEVALAASYLRDRVGVPRDLSFAAARQLRAHLQWLVHHHLRGNSS
ncbi:hypothetical protein O6H91_08G097600 [Diphasiastrum complanatum]|uniref:Uncharacterized protein n=1 Tax=Diphasiastrum complanatum TaxID=34168 RepID=A0ACC2D0D3_DIPCM|nr:hypothetical protein O6H91_08G097600 [Diphasiastrum complanatum]